MARIAPFCGLRYNPEKIDKMEDVVSPPYDVIDKQAQNALFQKNPYNMIKLDLSKNVDATAMVDERYNQARQVFDQWQRESVLIRDKQAAIYLYYTDYTLPSGKRLTRKGFISLVGLAEFSEGIVKPHEKTFRGVTTDRLRLIDTCIYKVPWLTPVWSVMREVPKLCHVICFLLCRLHKLLVYRKSTKSVVFTRAVGKIHKNSWKN